MGNDNHILNESPIPLYYQIYVDLKNKLLVNKLVDENGKLPAEKDLAEAYKVSRVTMRQAIAELEKDGLIVRFRGRGSFLKSQPNQSFINWAFRDRLSEPVLITIRRSLN